jgi:hypothetical protein
MTPSFVISQGNLPTLQDTLRVENCPVDLTGATVTFTYQGPATATVAAVVTDASCGKVQYQFTAGQTTAAGNYQGQWTVTDSLGGVRSFPTVPFAYIISAALPTPDFTGFTRISDLYDDVRAVTGDFKRVLYDDAAIASVMRVQLRLGRVHTDCKRWMLAPDNFTLSPPITSSDCLAYGQLVYTTAQALIGPNLAAYNYRTRALSERFGEQRDFIFLLNNTIYQLENGEQAWGSITGLRSWLFSLNGIWAWSYQQAEQMIDLSFK